MHQYACSEAQQTEHRSTVLPLSSCIKSVLYHHQHATSFTCSILGLHLKPDCLPLQDIEKALMRADVDRDKLKDRHNRPDAVAKGLDLNDASRVQRRGKMMLPAPQVSEQELQQIAKGGGDVDMDPDLAEGGTDATRRLLGDYQTPQRCETLALCSGLPLDMTMPHT